MKNTSAALLVLCILFICSGHVAWAFAESTEDLKKAIDEHSTQIASLNREISLYEQQLKETSTKKQTLKSTLVQIDIAKKKTEASISVAQNQIGTTQLEIQQLDQNIGQKNNSILTDESGLSESLRRLSETETLPFAANLLSSGQISAAWRDIDNVQVFEDAVRLRITRLAEEKRTLSETKSRREVKHKQLVSQKNDLLSQQGALSATRRAQQDLLVQTKSQESTFQRILLEKQAAKASFESALTDLQAQFQKAVNLADIPKGGSGILKSPSDRFRLTQNFGSTDFSRAGGYNGKGHNGIDLAASVGTPIRAAMTGVVLGTGNTDAVRGCYSYGKWIMIQHDNGLNTMYAHLSQVNVSEGQGVATGEVIGYSGQTGYATGPHLHFGVYLGSATQIVTLGSATNRASPCSHATMPIAPLSAYLNPMSYL